MKQMDDKNPMDIYGKTPLDYASEKKHWEVVYHLILENKLHISYIDIL